MAKVKKIVRRAKDGDDTKRCKIDKQGNKSCGPVGQGKPALPGKMPRMNKKEEKAAELSAKALEPYERDFPGDIAPGGFGAPSEGKKSTRWRTDEKKGIRYMGQALGKPRGKSGIKVAKKSAPKKAKSGTVVKKSKKK